MAKERVAVCCKLPNGMMMQLWQMHEVAEPIMGGGSRMVPKAFPHQKHPGQIKLNGNATHPNAPPNYLIVNGAAITMVDKDFMEEWLKQNAQHDAVKNRQIFMMANVKEAQAKAKNDRKIFSGQQPLNPEGDPRAKGRFTPKPFNRNDMSVDPEQAEAMVGE